jgi:hypothetical protein
MTTAEELRKYADKALREGGIMYFSDEYLDALASRAEEEQAETEKLRELAADMWTCIVEGEWDCSHYPPRYVICDDGVSEFRDRARELGLEVDDG